MTGPFDDEFDAWYRRVYGRVYGAALLFSGTHEQAQDLAADAFVRAFERWPRVRAMDSPVGWTVVVATNLARRRARRHRREATGGWLIEGVVGAASDGAPDLDLWRAVAGLSLLQKRVIVLRYLGDLTEPQVAAQLHISRAAVASALQRARSTLARTIAVQLTCDAETT